MELCMYRVKDSDVDFCIFYIPSFTKKSCKIYPMAGYSDVLL